MFCPYCGQQNSDELEHCRSCGETLPEISRPAHGQPSSISPRTSKLAIWSLILSLSALLIGASASIAGLICGIIGIKKIRNSAGAFTGKGFAIAGTVISSTHLIISIPLAVMMAMNVMAMANRMVCSTNITSLSKALLLYADNNDGRYPNPNWCNSLIEATAVDEKQFLCPNASDGPCSYAMNASAVEFDSNSPGDLVLLFETSPGWNKVGGPEILTTANHQGKGSNVTFTNGSVRFVESADVNSLKWSAE